MPLPEPVLDNRDFEQLVAEGVRRIPRLAPGWTDHNASDPGITLLELGAWLSEQNLFRMDRETRTALRGFLQLVGLQPRPPAVATAVLALDNDSGASVPLPARLQLHDGGGGPVFETRDALTLSPARLVSVLAGRLVLNDVTPANANPFDPAFPDEGSYQPFGPSPRAGAALYLGFNRPLGSPGERLALYIAGVDLEKDTATRARLFGQWQAERDRLAGNCPFEPPPQPRDWRRHYRASVCWEYRRASGDWRELPEIEDETRALSLSGFVRFSLPPDQAAGGPGPGVYLRCRLSRGRFECPPRIDRVLFNAVTAEHARTIAGEQLGLSHGHAGTAFTVEYPPVVAGSTRLTLGQGPDLQEDWREVLEWDRVGAHQRAYRLDPAAGTLAFGDGRRGQVPAAGLAVAADYRSGGGPLGNLAPNQLTQWDLGAANHDLVPGWEALAADLAISQPLAAFGGAEAQTLAAAQAEAIEQLTEVRKAVTLGDFETLAKATPGVPVGLAWAIPGHHPALPCWQAHGSVGLVLVPDCPGPAPMPSQAMLDAVARWLEPRRLVTSELHLMAPCYVGVQVRAQLHARRETDVVALHAEAVKAIADFLHPLHGGPEGTGWQAGRDLYRSELLALLAGLPGVARVTEMGLRRIGAKDWLCANLTLCARELLRPGQHQIEIRPADGAIPLNRSLQHECP